MKNTFKRVGFTAALAIGLQMPSMAQDIHFTQFNMAPLVINPAFTGGFNGQYRVAAIYRDQWRSISNTAVYKTIGASIDAPILRDLTTDDYLAVGVQLYNDRAGDGNLSYFTGLASVAYHKFLGEQANKALSVGFQGGYSQGSLNFANLHFADQFLNGSFQGPSSYNFNNKSNYLTLNAGIAWSHSASERFGYTLGASANNLNQPDVSFMSSDNQNSEVGLGIRYAAQAGAIAYLNDKFSLRPGVLYQTQSTATEIVAGNEFHLIVGQDQFRSVATGVFAGVWYRANDAIMINAGVEWKGFRFGVAYDYNTSDLNVATNNNGAFELAVRYIGPSPLDFARRLIYPCARF